MADETSPSPAHEAVPKAEVAASAAPASHPSDAPASPPPSTGDAHPDGKEKQEEEPKREQKKEPAAPGEAAATAVDGSKEETGAREETSKGPAAVQDVETLRASTQDGEKTAVGDLDGGVGEVRKGLSEIELKDSEAPKADETGDKVHLSDASASSTNFRDSSAPAQGDKMPQAAPKLELAPAAEVKELPPSSQPSKADEEPVAPEGAQAPAKAEVAPVQDAVEAGRPAPSLPSKDSDLPVPPAPAKDSRAQTKAAETVAETGAAEPKTPALDTGSAAFSKPKLSPTPSTPSHSRLGKGPPPTTPAAEEKSFDFNRFLEQLRDRRAQPVGEYVRSFIRGFTKKPYRTADQTKLIFDFLAFISDIMAKTQPFASLPPGEFDNALEAMEKLVMNRLYAYTFAPAIEREGKWKVNTDDLERDKVLSERVEMMRWVREEHLDVPTGEHSAGFLDFATQELLKINHYKAPRDKVICILNSCKVIFGLIRHLSGQESADSFIPILIFVVLRANPDHLISNVEYINRFRSPDRLSAEVQYYISSLMGAIAFIETMDASSLSNITQEEFETNVEKEINRLADERAEKARQRELQASPARPQGQGSRIVSAGDVTAQAGPGEETARTLPLTPMAASIADDTRAFFLRTGEAARAGLGASLGKPMGALGKLFNEGIEGMRTPGSGGAGSAAHSGGEASPSRTDSPAPAGNLNASNTGTGSRRMFSALFGSDADSATAPPNSASTTQRTPSTAASFNSGTWSRSLRGGADDDQEPMTPASDELRQGVFASFGAMQGRPEETPAGALPRQGGPGQQQRGGAPHAPRATRVVPLRQSSMDPYQLSSTDDAPSSGVGTPTDDGSDVEGDGAGRNQASRRNLGRLGDLGSFIPSFLTEQPTPSRTAPRNRPPDAGDYRDDEGGYDEEARSRAAVEAAAASGHLSSVADESAEIERVHLAAGVETLRSVFPTMEPSVIEMVLEACNGDVQAAIDRLLEMS